MKSKRKRLWIILAGSVLVAIAAVTVATVHRPKRQIVMTIDGPPQKVNAVFIIDGDKQTKTATLPAEFRFYGRDLSYKVMPSNTESPNTGRWHVRVSAAPYERETTLDYSHQGPGTSGQIVCPNVFGMFFKCGGAGPEVPPKNPVTNMADN